jgi:hypothetical protein
MKTPLRYLAAAIAGAALLIVGPGAFATAGATTVLSDKITFSAQLFPNGSGGFNLLDKSCSLTSDGETMPFPCQISGTFSNNTGAILISTTVTSADGTITSGATLTCSSSATCVGKGRGTEMDAPDPGQPPPPPYRCIAKYAFTNVSGVLSGTITVKEPSTAP